MVLLAKGSQITRSRSSHPTPIADGVQPAIRQAYRARVLSFEKLIHSWGNAACAEWGYPDISAEWMQAVAARLPPGLRVSVAESVECGTVRVVDGHRFTLSGLRPGKGPYAFFSRSDRREPAPNWEYFVQVAEYRRVARAVIPQGLQVMFEHGLMDVAVSDDNRVLWCIEVKEKASDLDLLLSGIRNVGVKVDVMGPDRHNDPLRKSKYLIRHRPPYFSLVAIGLRFDFSVHYTADGFKLTDDLIPVA